MDTILSDILFAIFGQLTPTHQHVLTLVLGCLFLLSEILAYIPQVEANSVFQLIVNILVDLKNKMDGVSGGGDASKK